MTDRARIFWLTMKSAACTFCTVLYEGEEEEKKPFDHTIRSRRNNTTLFAGTKSLLSLAWWCLLMSPHLLPVLTISFLLLLCVVDCCVLVSQYVVSHCVSHLTLRRLTSTPISLCLTLFAFHFSLLGWLLFCSHRISPSFFHIRFAGGNVSEFVPLSSLLLARVLVWTGFPG